MSTPQKLRVALVFGGRSGEHEVSIQSAASVAAALDRDRYDVTLVGIDPRGRWHRLRAEQLAHAQSSRGQVGTGDGPGAALLPEPASALARSHDRAGTSFDVVFPVLHGTFGEDGCIQGLLELADLPYVGSGVLGSAVGMDKEVQKRLLREAGLPILPFASTSRARHAREPQALLDAVATLGLPLFVKPANLGSSVGISRVGSPSELAAALETAFRYDDKIVVERGIRAREIECAVLGNEDPRASVPGEIRPRRSFYSYEAKYLDPDGADLLIPADLDDATTANVQELSVEVFRVLDAAGMARVDFLLDEDSGALYVNELNSIPGFTPVSMYPKLWEHSGLPYPALLDRLIELARERHAQRARLDRSFQS